MGERLLNLVQMIRTDKRFRLSIDGLHVCDLAFDDVGKYTFGVTDVNEVHRFCRTVLALLDDLPVGDTLLDGLPDSLR